MGQNRIRGGGGVKNRRKSSDIIYVRSLRLNPEMFWLKVRWVEHIVGWKQFMMEVEVIETHSQNLTK